MLLLCCLGKKRCFLQSRSGTFLDHTLLKEIICSSMKKYFKLNAWIVVFLGLIVLILLGRFSSVSLEPGLINDAIFVLAFFAIFISFFGYLAVAVKDYFFRSFQMKGLAQKYNLSYTQPKEPFFTLTSPATRKNNIIEGKVNRKNILIYDFVDYHAYGLRPHSVSRSATIISVDGRKSELRGFFTGLFPIKKIDCFLADLK